jgi:hypothetical protein
MARKLGPGRIDDNRLKAELSAPQSGHEDHPSGGFARSRASLAWDYCGVG